MLVLQYCFLLTDFGQEHAYFVHFLYLLRLKFDANIGIIS